MSALDDRARELRAAGRAAEGIARDEDFFGSGGIVGDRRLPHRLPIEFHEQRRRPIAGDLLSLSFATFSLYFLSFFLYTLSKENKFVFPLESVNYAQITRAVTVLFGALKKRAGGRDKGIAV